MWRDKAEVVLAQRRLLLAARIARNAPDSLRTSAAS